MDLINWNNFCSTYDIHYLDIMNINSKELIKKYINKNDKEMVKFKGLYRILQLYFNNSIQNIKHCNLITPIHQLSYHTSTKYNKKIYIFGEHHETNETCKLLDKCNVFVFILNNIGNIPKFIDVFLETPYITKEVKKLPSYQIGILGKFSKEFEQCLLSEKKCKYENIRFHNTDIRQSIIIDPLKRSYIVKLQDNIVHFQYFLMDYLKINNVSTLSIKYDEDKYKKIIKNLKTLILSDEYKDERMIYLQSITSNEKYLQYLLKSYSIFKLEKQQQEIPYENVKNILLKFIQNKINKVNLKYLNITEFIYLIDKLEYSGFPKIFKLDNILEIVNYANEMIFSIIPILDMYLFSRMFRKFKQVKYKNSKEPEYIIIYVGNQHANNYRELLNELNFKTEFNKQTIKPDYCLDISNLKQPLFN